MNSPKIDPVTGMRYGVMKVMVAKEKTVYLRKNGTVKPPRKYKSGKVRVLFSFDPGFVAEFKRYVNGKMRKYNPLTNRQTISYGEAFEKMARYYMERA